MTTLNLRFLPWLRRGLARSIQAGDGYATMRFSLKVGGELVNQTLRVRGPGDVLGIDPAQIVRTEPRPGTMDFEPNYFPAIEFATPDLPWLFTPAAPDGEKLLPWLTLVTVDTALASLAIRQPLPVLTAPLSELPPDLNEMWAWAHVQTTTLYDDLTQALEDVPETFISRILSPRNLAPKTAYLACLVPTYEAGRLAGLDLPIGEEIGLDLAWSAETPGEEIELPVYYSWSFQTGTKGDFEMLVERLKPQELNETVGRRDLDLSEIGIPLSKQIPRTTLFFGGLVSPTAIPAPPKTTTTDPLREAIYDFLTTPPDPDPATYDYRVDDPVVTPAIYGREQLSGEDLPPPKPPTVPSGTRYEPVWYSEVNTHPRTRGAAGLGVRIVRRHQEDFMARAWSEVTSLSAINQTLQQATYASLISNRWQGRVVQLDSGALLGVTRSAHSQILPTASSQTVWGQLRTAEVPNGSISSDLQRITRSGGVIQHTMRLVSPNLSIQHEVRQMIVQNAPLLTAVVSTHALPIGAGTLFASEADDYAEPVSHELEVTVKQLDTILVGGVTVAERADAANAILATHNLAVGHAAHLSGMTQAGRSLTGKAQTTLNTANRLTTLSNQYVSAVAQGQMPGKVQIQAIRDQARTFQDALQDMDSIFLPTDGIPAEVTLDSIAADLSEALVPDETISAHLQARIQIADGAWGAKAIPSQFTASPTFDEAIYPYICELSPEYLLPGIGELPMNTVGLVEVNGEYVEAVLVGINHEMSREMLWREYPAPLNSTWFTHFWSPAQADIKHIADWGKQTPLGDNLIGFAGDDALVLLIKGDILRRYPNLSVYAVQATVGTVKDDLGIERRARLVKTPESQIFPAFSGELDTGVKFFGFDSNDIDIPKALGTATPDNTSTDGGWFFALQEQPTEPRFGLDEYKRRKTYNPDALDTWSELSWGHFLIDGSLPDYLSITSDDFDGKSLPDTTEDGAASSTWGSSAGAMARIVLQRPVRMLVHASAMLP